VRAGAAHELAKLDLQAGDVTAAEETIAEAADLAGQTDNSALRLGIGLTRGTIAEARGDWSAAVDAYRSVEDRAVDRPVQDVDARLRRALALLAWSRRSDDGHSAQHREDALMLLDGLASGSDVPAFVRDVAAMAAAEARLDVASAAGGPVAAEADAAAKAAAEEVPAAE
jgi:ATP/maltotriose-dependent transcriptional regulator MalT